MGLTKKTRFEIFKRDLFTCQYCGRRPPDVVLEVDHIIPRADNGTDDPDNLTTSCSDCNRGKSDRPLEKTLPIVDEMQRLETIQEMSERAVLLKSQVTTASELRAEEDKAIATLIQWYEDSLDERVGTRDAEAMRKFIQQLSPHELLEAVDSTQKKGLYSYTSKRSYFYGCCWRMIRRNNGEEVE